MTQLNSRKTSAPYAATLAAAIKHNRERAGLSLSDVAKLAGITKAHVWEIEQGRAKNPTAWTILDLACALDMDALALAAAALASASMEAGK